MPVPFVRRAAAALPLAVVIAAESAALAQQSSIAEPIAPAAAAGAVPLPTVDVESPPTMIESPLTSTTVAPDQLRQKRAQTNDTARLLQSVAGISLYDTGGVSSPPVINGQADDRVNTLVNGMPIPSACSNHMNPPLSYIDPSNVGSVTAITGITPVSQGGDSTGGTVIVNSPPSLFAEPGETVRFSGETAGFYRSISDTYATSLSSTVANDTYSLNYSGAFATAANYRGGGNDGRLRSTEYRAFNQALTGAARGIDDQATLQLGQQYIPYQGFPNQYMDMVDNRSYFANGGYERSFGWGDLTARTFVQTVDHEMNFLNDKGGTDGGNGGMPMKTDAINTGYRVAALIPLNERDTVNIGNELYYNWLDDHWPAVSGSMMLGPDRYVSINDGMRTRLGTFAEWEAQWAPRWSTLVGVRNDTVWMNAGDVQAYDPVPGMMNPDAAAAAAFNARGHARTDINFDLTVLGRLTADENSTYELGYARKTRSPNFYERYAWGTGQMASTMIGWFGDGNGYIGDIDLKPEVAHTVSATADWHGNRGDQPWQVRVTPYYTYIEDYIGVEQVGDFGNGFVQLQFANHDAQFYGVNVATSAGIWQDDEMGQFSFSGVFSWVRGRDLTSNDNAYQQMPVNTRLTLAHDLGPWSSAAEVVVVADKSKVDHTRNELHTPDYALLNLRTSYGIGPARLYLGVDNVFDTAYDLPLGGVALSQLDYNGGRRQQVWGTGRSFIGGLSFTW